MSPERKLFFGPTPAVKPSATVEAPAPPLKNPAPGKLLNSNPPGNLPKPPPK